MTKIDCSRKQNQSAPFEWGPRPQHSSDIHSFQFIHRSYLYSLTFLTNESSSGSREIYIQKQKNQDFDLQGSKVLNITKTRQPPPFIFPCAAVLRTKHVEAAEKETKENVLRTQAVT